MSEIEARTLFAGTASGDLLVLEQPLSFWGGVDHSTGAVIDVHHPQRGQVVSGKIVVMAAGRGSSSSSSVFAELVRRGIAPAAVVLGQLDEILIVGAIAAEILYARRIPFVLVAPGELASLATGMSASIEDGRLVVD